MTFDDWCKQNNIPDNVTTVCRMAFNARNREIKSLGERCNQLQKDKGNLTDRVRELEQQIEKMKNCKNCKKLKKEKDGLLFCTVGSFYTNAFGKNCDKWEIKEND